jgi:hypothetical protein
LTRVMTILGPAITVPSGEAQTGVNRRWYRRARRSCQLDRDSSRCCDADGSTRLHGSPSQRDSSGPPGRKGKRSRRRQGKSSEPRAGLRQSKGEEFPKQAAAWESGGASEAPAQQSQTEPGREMA